MKKDSKKLLLIAIAAFITFLSAFAMVFYEVGYIARANYEYGTSGGYEELALAFILPVFYFVLTAVAAVLLHNPPVYKRPYIIMAVVSIGLIAILWIIYVCSGLIKEQGFDAGELWYPIVLSVLSLAMFIGYVSIAADIIKTDKKIKQNNQSEQ